MDDPSVIDEYSLQFLALSLLIIIGTKHLYPFKLLVFSIDKDSLNEDVIESKSLFRVEVVGVISTLFTFSIIVEISLFDIFFFILILFWFFIFCYVFI